MRRDIIYNATVSIGNRTGFDSNNSKPHCVVSNNLGAFKDGRFEVTLADLKISFSVKCIHLTITQVRKEWIAIREIAIIVRNDYQHS